MCIRDSPEAVVVPLGSLGGTDSRRFETVCPHVYRLSPINNAPYKKNGYTSGAHGTNEKAVVESLAPAAALYIEPVSYTHLARPGYLPGVWP